MVGFAANEAQAGFFSHFFTLCLAKIVCFINARVFGINCFQTLLLPSSGSQNLSLV